MPSIETLTQVGMPSPRWRRPGTLAKAWLTTLVTGAYLTPLALRAQASSQTSHLFLTETRVIDESDALSVQGTNVSTSGSLVAWSRNTDYLLLWRKGTGTQAPAKLGQAVLLRPVAAAFDTDSTVEVVDAGRAEIFRISVSGHVLGQRRISAPNSIEVAARSALGWYVGGFDHDSAFRLYLETSQNSRHVVLPVSDSEVRSASVVLSAYGKSVLVTSLHPPFRTFRISSHAPHVTTFTPLSALGRVPSDVLLPASAWISLPIVPLDKGFIQSLADLRSDRRIFILYDQYGNFVRRSELDVPLAFYCSLPARQLLIAARHSRTMDLVEYRWEWRP